MAVPMQKVARLAAVMRSNGVKAVSGSETRTRRTGNPISSAAICASAVLAPWPISTELVKTFKLPSALSLMLAVDVVGVAMPFTMALMPFALILLPSLTTRGPSFQPIFSAADAINSL